MNRSKIKDAIVALAAATLLNAYPVQADSAVTNNYPTKALKEGRQGDVRFHLVINEKGLPESCKVTESSGSPDLDEATCSNVLRRAKFKPATDSEGKPIKGTYDGKFRWIIPAN